MRKRTYRPDRVQLAAFGIAHPEQGALFSQDELDRAEAPDDNQDHEDRDDWLDEYAALGLEPLTLDPQA
jgi:hypothetical protein